MGQKAGAEGVEGWPATAAAANAAAAVVAPDIAAAEKTAVEVPAAPVVVAAGYGPPCCCMCLHSGASATRMGDTAYLVAPAALEFGAPQGPPHSA